MADYLDRTLRTSLTLPFAVSDGNRTRDFTKDLEMAAILYLAESDRNKRESHILRQPDEKLVFIAEACYPIWLVPWNGGTLLFDGLGATAHTIAYETLPDTRAFNRDIQNAKTAVAYVAALSRNTNYFKNLGGKQQKKTIEGLIASPELLKDFSAYLPRINRTEKHSRTKAVLSPALDRSEISNSARELTDVNRKINSDIKNLNTSMQILNKTTRKRVKTIRKEITNLRKKSSKQINKVKPGTQRTIRRIQRNYDRKITRISRLYEKQLQHLHKDQIKNKKMRRHLTAEVNDCEAKIDSCKRYKNERGKNHWTRKLKAIRKRLNAVNKNLRETHKRMLNAAKANNEEMSEERLKCDLRIEQASKTLRELEASQEATVKIRRQKIKPLQDMTALIMNQMNELIKAKKATLSQIDTIAVPRRKMTKALVYVPFYCARYEKESKRRYIVYPPSILGNMGIVTKMKGALGAQKIKTLLQPRSKPITAFLNQLPALIQKNRLFERELTDAGIQASILRRKKLRLSVKRGLKQLKQEDWISKNELQTLGKLLYIYA